MCKVTFYLALQPQADWRDSSQCTGDRQQQGGLGMAAIFGPGGLIILPWTVRGDHFRGGTAHGMTHTALV